MRKFSYIFFFGLFSASVAADVSSFVNVKKISDISKRLVHEQKNMETTDLEVSNIITVVSPISSFVYIEAHLYQISSKKEFTLDEIKKYKITESEKKTQNHYKMTTFTVTFNGDKVNDGLVLQGLGTQHIPK